ncbi:helicase with zinc finger domain 2 [Myxocyprinus asiaticus]|uniref:helicase with zinc finger domain 2 n=1 Tax=Myxocyprinus asiaticus TaxID=70543 RepID=UPI002222445B|nr:helicase with zinc finger domain 2 [Myxocyprinus asiaticus]XP_051555397.1 helicase with zinc finger domain 2 [Myxocyprinus asiaticus]
MSKSIAMATAQSRDDQLQQFMQLYELRAACPVCTHKLSRISYAIISKPHCCTQDLLLVRAKVKGHRWSRVFCRPSYPRPSRYEVCWFFKEDVGCCVHRDRCTFATSTEEAAVWNLQKHTKLDHKRLIHLINQREQLTEQNQHGDGQSSSQNLSLYQEKLLEEYRCSSNEICIISEQVDDVCVTQDQSLCVDCLQTDSEIIWKFKITTERSLAHVALLKVESGAVFSLGDSLQNTFPPITHTAGHHLRSSLSTYELSVCFLSFRPGVYEQWLVFDFEIRPVLLRKLKVRVGQQFHTQPVEAEEKECAEILSDERWNRGNRVIVPFYARKEDEQLLSKYKPPQMNLQFSLYTDHSSTLHQDNYRERAHYFLFKEEIAEEKLISRLNICGSVSLTQHLNVPRVIAAPGRLIATLKVSCSLTPDSPEGLMLKRGVKMALVNTTAAKGNNTGVSVENRNRVYEALVCRQATDEGHISLELSAPCVSELQMKKESRCEMEVQFQLNRLWFCQMHQAIDLLPDLHYVLPDLSNCCVPVNITKQSELNNKQQIALNFILGKCEGSKVAAPLLIYGPFGTGKTLCLASAAKKLASQPQTRVLICTYTNSSADLYVRMHFHPYITNGHPDLKVLRIKANKGGASMMATDNITLKYCLCSYDGQSFILPARSHLESNNIIITTTSMARYLRELKLPADFFSHILIDEASQMLEGEALMALGLADKHTRVVLAGDHMQMAPKLFSVTDDKRSEHTLLNRLFRYYQDQSSNIAKRSRVIFNENYRSTAEIVDFVSTHFYVSDGIKAKGDVPPHPRLHPLIFQHVRGECNLNSTSMSWCNRAEVTSVINVIQGLVTDWPMEWGEREPMDICVLSEGQQLDVIKNQLRTKQNRIHGVSVQNLANIQGKQFRVIIISTVQSRDRLLQSESSCLEFFEDIRALNTALTRAQSLVVVVGDAGALCCFGKCSRIWRAYIEHCISKGSAKPDHLTRDFLQQEMLEISKFQKRERVENSESDAPIQAETDLILKEMMDDYDPDVQDSDAENESNKDHKRVLYSSTEKEDLLELVRKQPAIYKHGEMEMEGYQSGYVIPYDKPSERIYIKGRKNIGMCFPGDEVVVEIGPRPDKGSLTGRVLGATNRAASSSEFVCSLEVENYRKRTQETDKNFLRKIMIPLSINTTKICVLVSKKSHNFIPIWKFVNDKWTLTRYVPLDEHTKQEYVFVVQILCWKAHCSFPLGNVTNVLPIGTTLEEGLQILKLEYNLGSTPLIEEDAFLDTEFDKTDDSKRRDFRDAPTFTVDRATARNLDDAISVKNLGNYYEIGVHVADVASFVSKDSPLDNSAKELGATFYNPREDHTMFPKHLTTNFWSLLPGKDRKAISVIVKVEKDSGIITERTFCLSMVNSRRQLTYKQAEGIISQCDGELRFKTLEDCVRVAYLFARTQRKARLKENWNYAQPDKHRKPGEREAYLMIEELNIMFNNELSKFLTENINTKLCTPLRCQAPPTAEELEKISDRHTELIPLSTHLTYHIDRNRVDLHNTITFTVYSNPNPDTNPSPLSTYLQDAISVSYSEYHFEIGVHKADVSGYNIKNLGAQSSMWSLMPGQNRRAISLLLKVEKKTCKIVEQKLVLSSIKSSRLLSYSEVDSIINLSSENERMTDSLEGCFLEAFHFASDHRQRRIVDTSNAADLGLTEDSKCKLMMEELNLMLKEASDHLMSEVTTSLNTFSCPLTATPELVRRLKRDYEELGFQHLDSNNQQNNFIILTSVWEKIESAALDCDFYKMADLISTDDLHPQLLPVIVQLKATLNKAYFIRSLSCQDALVGHYSLHLDSYTYASSPMRRYIDVIIQRLMHAVLSDRPVEYSKTDIDLLCDKCKRGESKAQEYENKAESLFLAISLQKQSTYKLAFVTVVQPESESFKLSFPFDKGTFPDKLPVLYRDLQLEDQPIYDRKQKQMTLTWKKRIYSLNVTPNPVRNLRFCSEIQKSTWHAIVEAVREEKWEVVKCLILGADVKEHCEADEVQLDIRDHTILTHYLKVGDTVQVQLTSERQRGYWAPTVQLLSVSSSFEICVEHTHNPIKCFSKCASHPSKGSYINVEDYVQIWKPICEMESAATAVDDSDCVVIENVHIAWTTLLGGASTGTFSLPVEYVKKWAIEFDLAKCFLCIRKRVLKPITPDQSGVDPDYYTWVAHGVTTQCLDTPEKTKNKSKIIRFKINYASMDIPKAKMDPMFTVEVIPKLLPDIRKESAVNNLTMANELVKNIALGQRIRKVGAEPVVSRYELMRKPVPADLPPLNESQFNALEKALNGTFTLIQGPPGTGKTVVGAYIVYWFSQLNAKKPQKLKEFKEKEKREVILYCGPSNKSVDVVAEYLLKFGEELKILRVYSRQMEMQEYPYPGSDLQLSHKSLRQEKSKPELKDITLHHRIRECHNPNSQAIVDFDERIANNPNSLTDEDIEDYKKLLNAARLYELERHDVILCTCTAAASPNLTKTLTARQILIDECAMATEPQTLVPLVSFKPEKVVLLGDHKQLRPIVKNEHVRKLGMTHSLFERYMAKALLLDTQYRMHEEICKFPSMAYYQGKLKTKVAERTSMLHIEKERVRQSKHILFGDVQGVEISLVVSTARGNQNSKANLAEVKKAVEICGLLVSVGHVRQEEIAILSPYNAQVAQIRERLLSTDINLKRVTVTTITKSQGSEWRYVILSMVRSCPSEEIEPLLSREWLSKHIGFVGDENQISVGITRAQDGLCILGNQELLNCSQAWTKLLKHYSGHGCVVSADQITVRHMS